MSGHRHNPSVASQNQGNSLGDRSCVRQSKLYRMYESGNDVKSCLGSSHLSWDPNVKQGAYSGQPVYDHSKDGLTQGRQDSFGRNENHQNYSSKNNGKNSNSYGRQDEEYYGTGSQATNYDQQDDYSSKQPQRGNRGYNDENAYSSGRNQSYQPRQEESDCYPLNKMKSDDGTYRAIREQAHSAPSYQSVKAKTNEMAVERVGRSFVQPGQQDRSTRPW